MKVRFYELTEKGTRCIGAVHFKNGKLIPRPASSIALKNVLTDTVEVNVNAQMQVYTAANEPELFLKSLPRAYHGSYFYVGKIEDD